MQLQETPYFMTLITTTLAIGCLLFFLWMGAIALRYPGQLLRSFGLSATTPDARNEIRAVYGGFGIAVASLLGVGLLWRTNLSDIALTLGVSMAGMAGGRIISAVVDRQFGKYPRIYLFVELVLVAALLVVFLYGRS